MEREKQESLSKKKKIISIIVGVIIVILGIGIIIYCTDPRNKVRGKGTPRLENPSETIITIKKHKKCIPIVLSLYADGTYELFTDYADCHAFQVCTLRLHYTKSLKGTYDYDLTKILDNSIDKNDALFGDSQIDYEISTTSHGSSFILGEEYARDYVTKKDPTNKYLDEFLKSIDVDLDICAISDYQ